MIRRVILIHVLVSLILSCYSKECQVLKNAKVTVFTGGQGLNTITVQNEEEDLQDAYKITIQNLNIPVLCKQSIQNLPKLDNLVIDSSGVQEVSPGAFENLPSLRSLSITNNNIKEIETGTFGDLLIRKLNLSSNEISKIQPRAFENLLNLEVVILAENQLTTFENTWFKYTPKLYRLEFMFNKIKSIPENAFVNIIKDKQKKHDLELWFMYNNIESIHKKAFNKLERIETLWLNNNSLSNIDPEVFAQVQHIQHLDLDNNQFSCFDVQFLKSLNVKELNINGNPIDCECLKTIKNWAKEEDVQLHSLRIGLECLMARIQNLKSRKFEE